MAVHNYFTITALPALGDLGSLPPVTGAELVAMVDDADLDAAAVRALVLQDDLRQREAFMAGVWPTVEPAVLTPGQARNEEPLPDPLASDADPEFGQRREDMTWSLYYHYAARVASDTGSAFLAAWTSHEVALQNAIAAARANRLGLDPNAYFVAAELGADATVPEAVISDWSAAADPLAALRGLDSHRMAWIAEHDDWFRFTPDELAAYAAKLLLVQRWHRLRADDPPAADNPHR